MERARLVDATGSTVYYGVDVRRTAGIVALASVGLAAGCFGAHAHPDAGVCAIPCPGGEVCCESCETGELACIRGSSCPPRCGGPCRFGWQCGPGAYCARLPGACEAERGECTLLEVCPEARATVCGCDSRTYRNACEAAHAGTSVARPVPCGDTSCAGRVCPLGTRCCPTCAGEPSCMAGDDACPDITCGAPCTSDEDCDPSELCRSGPDDCAAPSPVGRCEPVPRACDTDGCEPRCGCDGRVYCNECEALRARTAVRGPGPCPGLPCGDRVGGCAEAEYCDLGPECGPRATAVCRSQPATCVDGPVCGCDERTYADACLAASRGVTVASGGACPTAPRTCLEIQLATTDAPSGVYTIMPEGEPRDVWCDMDTDGGGWTLVAMSRRETLDDQAGPYHDELTTRRPESPHPWVWDGLRSIVPDRSDIRFTCHGSHTDLARVDLSFYDVDWYRGITTGTDAESCFNENDGEGFEPSAPARRDNVHDTFLPLGTAWAAGYLEGEDRCGDEWDFCVDFRDRGMDGDPLDGTDWGEDDTSPKCGSDLSYDGIWGIWIRET